MSCLSFGYLGVNKDMNIEEAKAYLYGEGRVNGGKANHKVLRDILEVLGNPDKNCKKIHIVGTNGKGSVAAYSAYILAAAGYRVAQYSSPDVYRFGERMRILDGRNNNRDWSIDPKVGEISDEDLCKYLNRIRYVLENMEIAEELHPNYFDFLLLVAFLYFAENDCDIWIIEAGIGARLDATNVIDSPEVAVVTAIGKDHVDKLGDTLEKIAIEKSYLLKEGTKALCMYDQSEVISDKDEALKVMNVFEKKAASFGIPVVQLDLDNIEIISRNLEGQKFNFIDKRLDINLELETKLLPDFEPLNAALAISACKTLEPDLMNTEIAYGVSTCFWPARLEKISDDPIILIDGAHNPQGARALRSSLDRLLQAGDEEIHIFTSMRDKDQYNCLREIFKSSKVSALICSTLEGYDRALESDKLFNIASEVVAESFADEENRPIIYNSNNIETAVKIAFDLYRDKLNLVKARNNRVVIVNWGSFYTAKSFKQACEIELDNIKKLGK